VAHPGTPPRRLSERPDDPRGRNREKARRAAGPERPRWRADAFGPDDTDVDLPPWAGPAGYAVKAGGTRRAGAAGPSAGGSAGDASTRLDGQYAGPADAAPEPSGSRMARRRKGRAAAARLRKSRRRVYRWSVAGVAVCVVGAVIAVIATQSSPKPSPYVTSLLPGEFKSVPSACGGVSASVLGQYLPGHRTATNQFSGATNSQCSFTVDAKPVFRLLEVTAQAFQPFAAASGNGSASANATDSFAVAKATLAKPPKKSLLSAAQVTALPQLGQQAFAAAQREQASGIVSDVVTVVVRDRNVLITVVLSAQETPGFSPTPVGTLQAGATAAAGDMLAKLKTQPVA
jgi:hypothetical protein